MFARLYARLYDLILLPLEWLGLRRFRAGLVAPASGLVLEVGAGTGLNFDLYRHARCVVALDPNGAALERARRRMAGASVPIGLVEGRVESLPFPDALFDEAVATLVFCTVGDPEAGLCELRRVLKPAGRLRLIEHVRSSRPAIAAIQNQLTPLWSRVFGGCHLNRDTLANVQRAGFDVTDLEHRAGDIVLRVDARRPATP